MIGSRVLLEYPSGALFESDEVFHSWVGREPKSDDKLGDFFSDLDGYYSLGDLPELVEQGSLSYLLLRPKFTPDNFDFVITYIDASRAVIDTEIELYLFPLEEKALESGWKKHPPRELFDSITDFILICTPDHTIKKANDAAISVFGSSDDIEGKKCYAVLRDRSEPCDNCPLPQTLEKKKVIPAEHYDPHLGEYMETRTYPLLSEDGMYQSFTLVTRMISYRREQEVETTQSKKLQALGRMASGIAHDFNNMLTIILGRLQLLKNEIVDTTLISNLKTIEKAALDSTEIIQRLQDFTRDREKDKDAGFTPLDLNVIIEDVVDYSRTRIERAKKHRGVHIEIETQLQEIPLVEGNKTDLRNALINLIFNAVDALDVGGLITIWSEKTGTEVEIGVSDTGGGMTPDILERIFDPFFTTKGEKGNGLGLSELYGIINQHDATIDVESTPGEGSTFTLHFPALVSNKLE